VVGYFGSGLLSLLWLRNRKNVKGVITQIRNRLPVEAIMTTDPEAIDIKKTITPRSTATLGAETTNPAG